MDLKTSQSQYVISLDAIDLSYIATVNNYKSHGVTEIWTKQNLTERDNEYYEFEIKEEIENEVGENSHSEYVQIPCCICNIDVPKIFFKDHLNSKKHNTFQKIINESLDRMKKVVSNEVVIEDKNVNKSIYFCASCVAVVKTNEKISHENSLGHRNSLAVDKIFSDFYELFTDNKELGNEGTGERKILHSKKCKEMTKVEEQSAALPETKNEISEYVKFLTGERKILHSKKCKEMTKVEEQSAALPETKNEILEYVKFLNKSYNFKDIKLLDCRYLELKTNSGSKVQIPERHFHSIINHSKNEYYCILCATTLKKKLKWDHLYEEGHVERTTIPFVNEHCLRKIDASWNHCAICNTKVHIQHQLEHKSDVIHKLYLNTPLHLYNGYISLETQKGIDFEANIQTRTNCSNTRLCQDDPDVKNDLTLTNNTSQKQNVNISKENQTTALLPVTNVNSESPVTKDDKKQETVPSLSDEVVLKREGTHIHDNSFYCAICKMNIPNHNYNIYDHLTTAPHMKKANELAKEELIHVHYNMDLTKFPQLECLVCKKTLPLNNSNNITGHISGSTHKRNHKLMLSDNKLIEIQKNEYYCEVCQLPIGPMYELVHCQTKKHLEKLKPITDDNSSVATDTSSTSSSNIIQEDIMLKAYLLENASLKQRLCLVCDVKVPDNINNIKSHLTGRLHENQYKITLERDKIRPEGNKFKCELCNVIVHTGNEIQHIKGKTHCAKKRTADEEDTSST